MRPAILCDFDGTIALQDTTDLVLSHFAAPEWEAIEQEWKAGLIGSAECMRRQVELIDAAPQELNTLLESVEIDPHFRAFSEFCAKKHVPLLVASDGVDYFIHHILAHHGMDHLPVRSNRMIPTDERHYTLAPAQEEGHCRSRAGTCKCAVARRFPSADMMILIGDGRSDFCLAHEVDLVIAKTGLLDYCQSESLNYIAFSTFADVQAKIEALIEAPNATIAEQPAVTSTSLPL